MKSYTHLRTSSIQINRQGGGNEQQPDETLLLRSVPDSLPPTAQLVIVVELCERFAFCGLLRPLQNYIQIPNHARVAPGWPWLDVTSAFE